MCPRIVWPEGKAFAFTIFDDPDAQTLAAGREVYALLADLGFRTTKGVWPAAGNPMPPRFGATCAEPAYRAWTQQLQRQGFEIGFHNATLHTSARHEIVRALEEFKVFYGGYPRSFAQHYFCDENIHWGDRRVSGAWRLLYNLATGGRNHRRFHGCLPGHPEFWGDLCRERIQYVRNFVFRDINTLNCCPWMPYHDPQRPYVNYWFASSEGAHAPQFLERIREAAQERLERQGGCCIMYTHFGHGFHDGAGLNARFRALMNGLARRNGWFAPVSEVLDYLLARKPGPALLTSRQRGILERRWLFHKLRYGTA